MQAVKTLFHNTPVKAEFALSPCELPASPPGYLGIKSQLFNLKAENY